MKRSMTITALSVIATSLWLTTTAPRAQVASPAATDEEFVSKAAVSDSTEVALGKMAVQRGASDEVKKFGQQMVDDHTMASQELLALAGKKRIPVPEKVDAKHQEAVDRLGQLQGEEFDRAYATQMVKDHEEAVSLFENESNLGQDPDLKAFATKTLPKLQEHLRMAHDLEGAK